MRIVIVALVGTALLSVQAQEVSSYYRDDIAIRAEAIRESAEESRVAVSDYIERRTIANKGARERFLQKKLRTEKYYAAVYLNPKNLGEVFWAAGYKNEDQANRLAAASCGEDCKLVAIFSNTCLMLAEPRGNEELGKVVVAYDSAPDNAIAKAKISCQRRYGTDCVAYEQAPGAESPAFCVGYDYGVYDSVH